MKNKQISIVKILNDEVPKYIRWCTPSVVLQQDQIKNVYRSDISKSMTFLNFIQDNRDIFDESQRFAAKVHHADKTLFVVNGSTGSNFIVFRSLSLENDHSLVLVSRNIHHSALNAMELLGIDFVFIPSSYDCRTETILPPSLNQIRDALREYPNADAIFITSPTYEGAAAKTEEIIKESRRVNKRIKIIVDEAWGAHLDFSEQLPSSAMKLGADISIQSVHKQGGALQQTSMIHWHEKNVNSELMQIAFEEYSTTSPSFHLLASIDAATRYLYTHKELVEKVIEKTNYFKKLVKAKLKGIILLEDILNHDEYDDYVEKLDYTKTLLLLDNFSINGFELKKSLERDYKIVAEKASLNTIEFITTFQISQSDIHKTVDALYRLLNSKRSKTPKRNCEIIPFQFNESKPVINPEIIKRTARLSQSKVPIKNSIGRISAERIELYPPGIPIILEGFKITKDAVDYLIHVKEAGGKIEARDPSLNYIYCI